MLGSFLHCHYLEGHCHYILIAYQYIAAELPWFITTLSINSKVCWFFSAMLGHTEFTGFNSIGFNWGSENSVDLRVLYTGKLFLPQNVDKTNNPPQEVIEMLLTLRFQKTVTVLPPFSLTCSISQGPQIFYSPE